MAKRALILGSQIGGLTGVESDTARMRDFLAGKQFAIDLRIGSAATREGILDGYRKLIADTGKDDAAVVYYSGHGHFAANIDGAPDMPRRFQGISPTDYDDSTEDDYRGISSHELSIHLARLTNKTDNVTVILDCCHSAQMSRDAAVRDAIPRGMPHPLHLGFTRFLERLREQYPGEIDQLSLLGNSQAVRLVACGQEESAYEYTNKQGRRTGAFTEALLDILGELDETEVTWGVLSAAIRERVLRAFPTQRSEVEGPLRRRLFSTNEGDPGGLDGTGAVSLSLAAPNRVRLAAGRIHGVSIGDVYTVMPLGAREIESAKAIARVSVITPSATSALASIEEWKNGNTALPKDVVAIPHELTAEKRAVVVIAPEQERAKIEEAVVATRRLRIAVPDDTERALATLRLADGRLTIEDELGPLFPPTSYATELVPTVKNVANLGVAQALRELEGEHGITESRAVTIELGVVEGGKVRALPSRGAALGLGDRICIRMSRKTSEMHTKLYVHLFNVGVRGKVTMLTNAPGIALERGDEYVFGVDDATGELTGLELFWPDGLPTDTFPRTDEIVAIVTTTATNLAGLETTEYVTRNGKTRLEQLLSQLQDGLTRNVAGPAKLDAFLVKRLSFVLHPRAGRLVDTGFQIDENPFAQSTARDSSAWIVRGRKSTAPEAIAIRLDEVVVNKNRALFATDIRIDALICTRSDQKAGYRVTTMPFKRIKSGDRLPLDKALLFLGPVRDFVDICLWVSRDPGDSLQLADLFAQRANSDEFRDAAAALLVAAGVAAAPWVTAVGASAVLARIAYELIVAAAGNTIGLYRTSFLAGEQFGVGRHPKQELYRAQDFSFALQIDPVKTSN